MDYIAIIKKSFQITLKNKFLWIFGILAGGTGGFKGFNVSWPSNSVSDADMQNKINSWATSADWSTFWANYGWLIMSIVGLFILFAIIMFVISIISQGALVGSYEKLEKAEKTNFHEGFTTGWHNFWRVWGVAIIYLLMILASLIILIIPIIVLIMTEVYILAVFWGILLFFLCLAFWILIGLISPYSIRVVVLQKFGVWQSIRESLHFFRDNWINLIVIYLLLLATGLGFGIVLMLGILIVGALLLGIGLAIWLASSAAAIAFGVLAGIVMVLVIAIASGAYSAFYSGSLTLTYLKLQKK